MIRLLPQNISETKRLKTILKDAKNSVESRRIMIAIVYMGGKNMEETCSALQTSFWTVSTTMRAYKKDKVSFYKTAFKGRMLSKEKIELKNEVEKMIIEAETKQENIDIQDVRRIINKKYKKEILTYHQAWSLVRMRLRSNYQKPYVKSHKQPENAEDILKERFTEALIKIGLEEKLIDGRDIKNKKTKSWTNTK